MNEDMVLGCGLLLGERIVRAGGVEVNSRRYFHEKLHLLSGESVTVYVQQNASVCAFIYQGNRYICCAQWYALPAATEYGMDVKLSGDHYTSAKRKHMGNQGNEHRLVG
jgi:hypothetical protein